MSDNTRPSWRVAMRSEGQIMSKIDFDNAFDDDFPDLLCNAAIGAHAAILDGIGGCGGVDGTNEILADYLYRRMLIEEAVNEFAHDHEDGDDLVERLNEELARCGKSYRLAKVPAA